MGNKNDELIRDILENKIRFVVMETEESGYLNTEIDLLTDIVMAECDRYGKDDGYPKQDLERDNPKLAMGLKALLEKPESQPEPKNWRGPYLKKKVLSSTQKIEAKARAGFLVIGIHALGAMAFLMIHFAISLSHVSLINALQGVQYVFLIILVYLLSKKYPQLLTEKFTKANVLQKIIAVAAITLGLIVLAVYA